MHAYMWPIPAVCNYSIVISTQLHVSEYKCFQLDSAKCNRGHLGCLVWHNYIASKFPVYTVALTKELRNYRHADYEI